MHWQLGGNFLPVIKTCKYSWVECPFALAYYIWFEVVTDVADCLANETILWRILAMLLVCAIIVHVIYWKIRWMNEVKANKENLKQINFKVQDLELKINILTYKAQYGTWPLPRFIKKSTKSNLHNIQSALLKLNEENSNINHLLPSQNNDLTNNTLDKCQLESKENLKTELSVTNLSNEGFDDDNLKLFESSSECSFEDHSPSTILGTKTNFQSNINFLQELLKDKDTINCNCKNKELKLLPLSPNLTLLANISPKFEKQILSSSTSDADLKKDTHANLCQIKERLEDLHLTLKNYNSKDLQTNKVNDNSKEDNNLYKSDNNNGNVYSCFDNQINKFTYNVPDSLQDNMNIYDASIITATYSNCNAMIINQIPIDQINNKEYLTSQDTVETSQDEENKTKKKAEMSNIFALIKELNKYKDELKKNLLENNITITTDSYCTETDDNYKNKNNLLKTSTSSKKNETTSHKTSSAEISKESDSDDKSTTALMQEDLKIKKELLSKTESNYDLDEQYTEKRNTEQQNEAYKYLNWQIIETDFQPKMLDMIVEESSGSSSIDKNNKNQVFKKLGQFKNLQTKQTTQNKIQQENNKNISIDSKQSLKNKSFENKIIIENKEHKLNYNKSKPEICKLKNNSETINSSENEKLTVQKSYTNIVESDQNNVFENLKNISCKLDETDLKTHEMIQQNLDSLKLKTDLNLSHLNESSSDTSVNRLIDRLIESERKCKSAKSLSNSKSPRELASDSLNNLIDSHAFLDTSAHSENEECNHFSIESDTEKFNNFKEKILNNDNDKKNTENDFIDAINSINNSNCEMPTIVEKNKSNESILNNEKTYTQDNCSEKNNLTSDIKLQNLTFEVEKFENNNISKSKELNHEEINYTLHEYNLNAVSNQDVSEETLYDNNMKQENKNVFESDKYNNMSSDDDGYIEDEDYLTKLFETESQIESEKVIDKKDAGDFCNNNKSSERRHKKKDNDLLEKSHDSFKSTEKKNLPSSYIFSSESSSYSNSPCKLKNILYHTPNITPTNNIHFSTRLRNSEIHIPNVYRSNNFNLIERQSIKSNYDLSNIKQVKTKSNLNLTSIEKVSPLFLHRRSKSYVTPRDVSFDIQHNKIEKKNSSESIATSYKSVSKSCTLEEPENQIQERKFQDNRESSFESVELASKSSSNLQIPIFSKDDSINEQEVKFEIKKCNSFKSLSLSNESLSKSHLLISPRDQFMDEQDKNEIKTKNSVESLIFSSKNSSKSCIPILKNKLETIRKNEHDFRSRSPVRGPLTMAVGNYRIEQTDQNYERESENVNKLNTANEILLECPNDDLKLQYSNNEKHQAVFYVNTINESDQFNKDSKKFLEYMRNENYKIQNIVCKEQGDAAIISNNHFMALSASQEAMAISSSIENDRLSEISAIDSAFQIQNVSSKSWSCKVDSKETEVLVKPTTLDTSTSITDLPGIFERAVNKSSKLKIFEVPDELTKEQYIALLQIVNENPIFGQSLNIDEL